MQHNSKIALQGDKHHWIQNISPLWIPQSEQRPVRHSQQALENAFIKIYSSWVKIRFLHRHEKKIRLQQHLVCTEDWTRTATRTRPTDPHQMYRHCCEDVKSQDKTITTLHESLGRSQGPCSHCSINSRSRQASQSLWFTGVIKCHGRHSTASMGAISLQRR